MVRSLILVVFLVISTTSLASFTEVARGHDGNIFYVDFSTLRKDGDTRTFWLKLNYHQITSGGESSARSKEILDCKREVYSTIHFTGFTGPNLSGAITVNGPRQIKWMHIAPNTVDALIMQAIC